MRENYIGLISGTSMDGIDAVVASFGEASIDLRATVNYSYPRQLRDDLAHAIRNPSACSVDDVGSLDRRIGECFRDAALEVIGKAGMSATDIRAIGSHGQTLRHEPDAPHPFSLQIGDPATIASGTGITTVADFRRADIAAGGQGAPLVPPFHEWLFAEGDSDRVILNIGGIANVTILSAGEKPVTGFDTGPGNTLMDQWMRTQRQEPFDRDGAWAASGTVIETLLEKLLACDYFGRQPPKSTGLEAFNLDWLALHNTANDDPGDVQATLCELTARTVADAITRHAPATKAVFVCGGGAHNSELLARLSRNLPATTIETTAVAGLDPDWVEAAAFAWLAMCRIEGEHGNLPSVTGAGRKVMLGAIHSP